MAVNLTATELAEAVGTDSTTATRLLAVATELVNRYAPDAPDAIANEGVIRAAGWLAEQPAAVDHGRDRRRYSDVLQPVDAIRAPALRRDGASLALEISPGGGNMTRRLALRRFPNEVVRRRQGPGGFNRVWRIRAGRRWSKQSIPARVLPLSLEDSDFVGGVSLARTPESFRAARDRAPPGPR